MPLEDSVRIVFCWTEISGYMGASWRALARLDGVNVTVFSIALSHKYDFKSDVMAGVDWVEAGDNSECEVTLLTKRIEALEPDAVFIAGWAVPIYREVARSLARRGLPLILTMDTPWRGDLRQRVGGLLLRHYLKNFDAALVPGARAERYAKYLGFEPHDIFLGLYAYDSDVFQPVTKSRGPASRNFIFVGRYSSEKGISTLIRSYTEYRRSHPSPWGLICCGKGPLASMLDGVPGVEDAGFVQPSELPAMFSRASCFVLPSWYEPWGVALAEACGAGLPVICTEAVGAIDELVRDGKNGHVVPANDAAALTKAMLAVSDPNAQLELMSSESCSIAYKFDVRTWAESIRRLVERLAREKRNVRSS